MTGRVATAVAKPARALRGLRGERGSMEANAMILMGSSIATGVLGIIYWIVAERFYATDDVGRAATMISSATMLSSLACLSLGGSYQRFLPVAGHRTHRLILAGLAFTAGTALLFGAAFLVFNGGSDRLFSHPLERWLFPLMVAVLAFFALLDPILIGLRQAGAVAAKNLVHAVAKIIPLPLMSFAATGVAIAGTWLLLAFAVSLVTTVVVLRRGLSRWATVEPRLPPTRQIWSFQSASLAMMLVQTLPSLLLPLIILAEIGAHHSAYYNIVASLWVAEGLLRAAVLGSYVVEASTPGADRWALTKRMMRMIGMVAVVAATGLAVGGPLLLRITGEEYFKEATGLVMVLGLEALLAGVVTMYAAVCWVTRRLVLLIATQAVWVAITVLGTRLMIHELHLTAVGVAAVAGQLVVLAIIAVPFARELRRMASGDHDDSGFRGR